MGFLGFARKKEIPFMADLADTAVAMANGVRDVSQEIARRGSGDASNNYGLAEWWAVAVETTCVLIHVVDRLSDGVIPEGRRQEFLGILIQHGLGTLVERVWKDAPKQHRASMLESAQERYSMASKEYWRCEDFTRPQSEGLGGTVLWEASKNLALLAEAEGDIAYIVYCSHVLVSFIDALELRNLVENTAAHGP